MKRIWEWYGIAGAFFLGVLVVFLGGFGASAWLGARPLARMLIAPTVGLVGVAVVLAVICWILNSKQPCEPDWGLWGKCLVLGVVVGLFLVGFALLLVCHSGRGTNAVQTIVLAVQAFVLAFTLWYVYKYVVAAQQTADDTKRLANNSQWTASIGQRTADVQFLSRSVLFVTDPIKTVGDYAKECHTNDKLGCDKSDWLMIEITNEGDKKAMHIRARASWTLPLDDVHARPMDRMQPLCKYNKFDGEEKNLWREWRLLPGESRLFYFPAPCKRGECDPKDKRTLRLIWYDVAYPHWTHDILVFQSEKDDKWYTSWWRGPELDYHKMLMSLPAPPEKE